MNYKILTPEVQAFIQQHTQENASDWALKKSPFIGVSSAELAQQLHGWQKTNQKIPEWLARGQALYFPEKLNLEQCSSSQTATFKASLLSPGGTVLDLTGGFGVDSYYFAQQARMVLHCEINPLLSQIVAYNFNALGADNIRCYAGDGLSFLGSSERRFDCIYADPSRRANQQKVFRLEDCVPNILAHQDLLFQHADTLLTKLAPLLDISSALQALPQVKEVYVISVDNDCKELLFLQEKGFEGTARIHAVRLLPTQPAVFSFNYTAEKEAIADFGEPMSYLYDPDVAVTKAGAFKSVATAFQLKKLHQHTHLYTQDVLIPEFPGRIFQITAVLPFSIFRKNIDLRKANIISKNFPLKVAEIRKKLKIKDGGEDYLHFTTLFNGKHVVIRSKRIL